MCQAADTAKDLTIKIESLETQLNFICERLETLIKMYVQDNP